MANYFGPLGVWDIILGALLAYIITKLILGFLYIRKRLRQEENDMGEDRKVDLAVIMEKFHSMFPIETFYFHGDKFQRGMKVKITTIQKKVFEGELIGKNEKDTLCILTRRHIIAHDIERIKEITCIDKKR